MADLDDVLRMAAIANRILADVGLATGVTASLGHASMRVPSNPETFVVKGREYDIDSLATVKPGDMVVCNLDGFKVGGHPTATQCSEVKIHSSIYKARPDVQSVVHVHPRFTVLMGVLNQTLVPMCQEGSQLVRNPLPVYPHSKTIQNDDEGKEVAALLGDGKVLLLRGHGAVTVGKSLSETVMGMLQLEEQARMNYLAYAAGGVEHPRISNELLDEATNRPPLHTQPHFKDLLAGRAPNRDGTWSYRVVKAAEGM